MADEQCVFHTLQATLQGFLDRIEAGGESKLQEIQQEDHDLLRLRVVFADLFPQTAAVILQHLIELCLGLCELNGAYGPDMPPGQVAGQLAVLPIDFQ